MYNIEGQNKILVNIVLGVGDNEGQNLTFTGLHFFFDNWDVENMNRPFFFLFNSFFMVCRHFVSSGGQKRKEIT